MELPEKDLSSHQLALLARVKAVTIAQFEIAREIMRDELQLDHSDASDEELLAIVQILATNYQAVVIKSVG
jgi:hypothetical protein